MAHLSEKDVYAKTVYAEARGEPEQGREWVSWTIKNRADKNRDYWGGISIKDVCLKPGQFECWNGRNDIEIKEPGRYSEIKSMTDRIYSAPRSKDPTGGVDHYNNPQKEGYPAWTKNCQEKRRIGDHVFYHGP